MTKVIKYGAPTLLFFFIAWVIYLADSVQDNWVKSLGSVEHLDKIAHFSLFGVFALLLNKMLNFRKLKVFNTPILIGSIIVLTFAIAEEFSQISFESRTFDVIDMIFDLLGILFFSSNRLFKGNSSIS